MPALQALLDLAGSQSGESETGDQANKSKMDMLIGSRTGKGDELTRITSVSGKSLIHYLLST